MIQSLTLRTRVILLLLALLITTVSGGVITIWYTHRIGTLFSSVVEQDLQSFQIAEEMETALVMQKGYTTYYFQDGHPDWLRQLSFQEKIFEKKLRQAKETVREDKAWKLLGRIEAEYIRYRNDRSRVLAFYQQGRKEEGQQLHHQIRPQFLSIVALCETYKDIHKENILQARQDIESRSRHLGTAALAAVIFASLMGILLAYILFRQILEPIRRLAEAARPSAPSVPITDEVRALSSRVHRLMEDMDQTQNRLARSQEQMLQSEKWALVGKLAAGVAHSIRNPLTSVKIRLFSMGRHPHLSPAQKEDLEVISTEISHIEAIVRNFLEFSRPPKLVMQKVSPSEVVDLSLRLLKPRLESAHVAVEVVREGPLPELSADPDQLKEVMVNLLVNACEVMVKGGKIRITEKVAEDAQRRKQAVLLFSDDGPGIPKDLQEKIFQPFFSTKEEGTGLGLSIASRIIQDHGGTLEVESREGEGTTFVITLPYPEEDSPKQIRK